MKQSEVQKELERFRNYVINEAKKNLNSLKKNDSKGLYQSLKGNVKAMPNSFYMDFEMNDYGKFQDKGVKGKDPSKVSKNARIKGQQAPNSPYKFGSGSASGQWGMFVSNIQKWAQKRNIRLRDDKGKYKKGGYSTIAQIIAGNIYNRGIKPSLFFTTPFEAAFKRLPDELVEKFGLDAMNLFKQTQFKNEKK
jgi:hypothetical protein